VSDPVTATQRAYLECFERWLRSPAGPDRDGAERGMGVLLSLMRVDVAGGIVPPSPNGFGPHVQWHVNHGVRNPSCRWCNPSVARLVGVPTD
jgi:hypothetical protein